MTASGTARLCLLSVAEEPLTFLASPLGVLPFVEEEFDVDASRTSSSMRLRRAG